MPKKASSDRQWRTTCRRQAHIDGLQDGAHHRHRKERLEKPVAVPVQHADRIARADADSCKRGGQAADPLPELAVSKASQVSIDDLLIGSLEQRRVPQMLDDERILTGGF